MCAAYAGAQLDHRWIPHDAGTIAQSAERVVQGQLPHRDFDEVYTGGESFLNAAAFRVMGTRLLTTRLVLYIVFVLWVASLLYVGTRFLPAAEAALVAVLATLWSTPNYAAAMPSWYNLFFATFGVAALLREAETGRRRWIWAAGALAGLSITFKIVGVYFIATALLYFAWREQSEAGEPGPGGRAYSVFVTAALGLFVLALVGLTRGGAIDFLEFVLPCAVLAGLVAAREWRRPPGEAEPRLRRLLGMAAPFLAGAALPLLAFALPYALTGSLAALLHGVFVLPLRRAAFATHRPSLRLLPLALPALALVLGLPALRGTGRRVAAGVALIAGLAVLLLGANAEVYRATFQSAGALVPLGAALLALPLWRWELRREGPASATRDGLFLLVAAAALWNLVRYPFSGPIYYFYVVPLLVLAAAAVAVQLSPASRRAVAGVLAFYGLFAVAWLADNSLWGITMRRYVAADDHVALPLERAGLRMTRPEAAQYALLVQAIREHASGRYTYATPDAPEVYFLSGLRNPTRTLFDFFDDPRGRTARIMDALQRDGVSVVAIKRVPAFSGPVPPDLAAALEARYPLSDTLGLFVVRWR